MAIFIFASAAPGAQPNIVLVTVDTTRPDHLSCYGYDRQTTPRLERLAAESILFSEARSVIPLTTPSHVTIMTGLLPENHQVFANSHPVDSSFTMMAEIFKKAGYTTGAFVSVRLVDAPLGFSQGFDFFSGLADSGKREQAPVPDQSTAQGTSRRKLERRGDETIADALRWLGELKGQRFFVWVHLYDPHLPYVPPAEYGLQFNPDYETYLDQIRNPLHEKIEAKREQGKPLSLGFVLAEMVGLDQEYRLPRDVSPELAESMIRAYDGEIAFADLQLGRLFDLLEEKGEYANTIIVVMGDHGEILYEKERYFGHHKYLYEGSVRIPVIMRFPGVSATRLDVPITNADILPTVLEAVGIESKVPMDGLSYWPMISRNQQVRVPERRFYVTNTGEPRRPRPEQSTGRLSKLRMRFRKGIAAVRLTAAKLLRKVQIALSIQPKWKIENHFQKFAVLQGNWKLIRSAVLDEEKKKRTIKYELYNLASDPQETRDLYGEQGAIAEQMKAVLTAFLNRKRLMKVLPEDRQKTDEERQEEMRMLRSLGYIQ
jgi:arylsulfatase A-like enzyme